MVSPKVSIIVPVYNVKKYIGDCLDSVCQQTYGNFEVLLIDDGSTDGSGDICDRYAQKDPRFKVWHCPNGGPGSARNVGLDNFTGEYVCFLDSDDELHPNYLDILVDHVSKEADDLVIYSMTFLAEDRIIKKKQPPRSGYLSRKESTEAVFSMGMWSGCRGAGGYVISKMFSRHLVTNLRFDQDRCICEDELFSIQAIECAKTIFFIDKNLYLYKQRSTSLSKDGSFDLMLVRGREKILNQVKEHEIKKLAGAALILALIRAYKTDAISKKEMCRRAQELREYRKILSLRRRVYFFFVCLYGIVMLGSAR